MTGRAGAQRATDSASCTRPSVHPGHRRARPSLRGDHQSRRARPATASRWRCGPASRSAISSSSSSTRPCCSTATAGGRRPLITEALRGEGAILVDAQGNSVTAGVHPMGDLAPRDVVAAAIDARLTRDRRPMRLPRRPRDRRLRATFPDRHRGLPGRRHRPDPPTDPGRARRALQLRRRRHRRARPYRSARAVRGGRGGAHRACTAPTGWRPTACSRAWWSAAGPARPPPSTPPRPGTAARGCPSRRTRRALARPTCSAR